MAAALWSRFRRMSTRRITANNLNIAQTSVKRIIKTQQRALCPNVVPFLSHELNIELSFTRSRAMHSSCSIMPNTQIFSRNTQLKRYLFCKKVVGGSGTRSHYIRCSLLLHSSKSNNINANSQ